MTSDGRRRLATTEATRTCRRHVTADLLAAIKTMSEITTVQRVRKSQRKKNSSRFDMRPVPLHSEQTFGTKPKVDCFIPLPCVPHVLIWKKIG